MTLFMLNLIRTQPFKMRRDFRMNKLTTIVLFIMLTACNNRIADSERTIESADAAYEQFDLKKSRVLLEEILLDDSTQNGQKCEALRRLAHQDWKYYKDYNSAISRLMKADSIGISRFDTWMLINRVERESQNFDNSFKAALEAEKIAISDNEITLAKIGYSQTTYTYLLAQLGNNEPLDTNLLNKTQQILSTLLESNAGMPKPSKLLLGISLLNNDGENVLRAWESYFHIQSVENTYPYLSNAAEKLSQVCDNWHGDKLGLAEQEMLIDALASSRFYDFIPIYVKKNQYETAYSQSTIDIVKYAEYLKEVKEATEEYYRLIAIEKENEKTYKNWLNHKREELWYDLSLFSQIPYTENDFLEGTEKYFGARGFTGSTGNYSGYVLCLGHTVNQETASIEQYGYTPEFLYTEIDMMTSNGYSSWFWEDKAIGGWATENEIIRVREVYLDGPFNAWKTIADTIERQKNEAIINDLLHGSEATENEQAEGLATKLRFDALNDLYEKLYSSNLRSKSLELAFLSTYEKYRIEASVLAHEGRHSIEKKYMPDEFGKWDNEEREFHAKLSQIVFATEPRLELAGMVNVMGESGHSKANRRIIDVAIEWLKSNKDKVIGFSEDKSEFSQIYLMSVEQLKECFKQADPLSTTNT